MASLRALEMMFIVQGPEMGIAAPARSGLAFRAFKAFKVKTADTKKSDLHI